jgi:RNA polymerase sigma-70 factor (ECF subfamily)
MLNEEADAEDTVQEVFLRLWSMRDQLHLYHSVEALAVTMTRNLCIDLIRKNKREEPLDEQLFRRAGADSPMERLEASSNDLLLRAIIDRLPVTQRSILRMKDMEELELDEIAAIIGSSNESVRVNLSRARKKVREEFIRLTKEYRQ